MESKKYIYCALDLKELKECEKILLKIKDYIGGIKLGLEFFIANGLQGVQVLKKYDLPIFLDLKLNDIPNTVEKAIESALMANPDIMTIHINCNYLVSDLIKKKIKNTKLIGVTLLTSLNDKDLKKLGINESSNKYVKRLMKIAIKNKLDGIVCAPNELKSLKKKSPKNFIFVTPGIRLKNKMKHDQKRTMSPGEAVKNGASIIVVGRPITNSKNPVKIVKDIIKDIEVNKN
tara:strand:- start:1509 stop:2204 length:696 start_codon:yes stop_codon:yes gene_type:complete